MSPNVKEEQSHTAEMASSSVSSPPVPPKDEPQSRVKEEIKEEPATSESKPTTVEVKEPTSDSSADDQDRQALREELRRNVDAFPPSDSEDSPGPERVAGELRRLMAARIQREDERPAGSPVVDGSQEGATAPGPRRDNQSPYAQRTGTVS